MFWWTDSCRCRRSERSDREREREVRKGWCYASNMVICINKLSISYFLQTIWRKRTMLYAVMLQVDCRMQCNALLCYVGTHSLSALHWTIKRKIFFFLHFQLLFFILRPSGSDSNGSTGNDVCSREQCVCASSSARSSSSCLFNVSIFHSYHNVYRTHHSSTKYIRAHVPVAGRSLCSSFSLTPRCLDSSIVGLNFRFVFTFSPPSPSASPSLGSLEMGQTRFLLLPSLSPSRISVALHLCSLLLVWFSLLHSRRCVMVLFIEYAFAFG